MSRFLRAAVAVLSFALCDAALAATAVDPFAGTWKLNAEMSQLTGDTVTFTPAGANGFKAAMAGQTYAFKLDGKPKATPFGGTGAWKKVDDRHYQVTWAVKGKTTSVDDLEVSEDGKTLAWNSKGKKPTGEEFEDRVTYERVSGEAGLAGKWRSTQASLGGLKTVRIEPNDTNGLVLTMVDFDSTTKAKLDGRDYPWTGPFTSGGTTMAFKPAGDRKIAIVQKHKGKRTFEGSWTLSKDGRTLTWDWKPARVDEPMTAVFDKE